MGHPIAKEDAEDEVSTPHQVAAAIRGHLAAGRTEEARLLLFESTRDSVYRYLRRMMRDDTMAEDLFQDTWLRTFGALRGFRGEASLTTWVLTIARNLALNRIRRQRTERTWNTDLEDPAPVVDPSSPRAGTPLAEAAQDALVDRRLRAGLDRLPPPQREAVVLYYLEDLPVEDVSRITGRPVNTIKSDLRRGRQALRECLSQGGDT